MYVDKKLLEKKATTSTGNKRISCVQSGSKRI